MEGRAGEMSYIVDKLKEREEFNKEKTKKEQLRVIVNAYYESNNYLVCGLLKLIDPAVKGKEFGIKE